MVKKTKNLAQTKATLPTSAKEYARTFAEIKKHVQEAQVKAALAANKELIKLYWYIGKTIVEKQKESSWGSSIIEQLAKDLQNTFPGIGGFSRANIFRMRVFFLSYAKVAQAVRQFEGLPICNIPWGHNVLIFQKIKNNDERLWYAQKTIDNGWSRSLLEASIKSDLYKREGRAITNFKNTLPAPQSNFAQQALKDPYVFDFLSLAKDYDERDVERGLIDNVQKMLLELGKGFSFVGSQYHLEVGEADFYIDLLFYHYKLRCFVVVELKARPFDPRDAGQLNFYLSAVDDLLRHPDDNPTIGILLCKSKKNIIAEYALRDIKKPIGVAGYETELVKRLPKELKSSLPTIEELEVEFEKYKLDTKKARPKAKKK
jgi:predicted nuclease of restriction endonuclease-like (RecB) superfamily